MEYSGLLVGRDRATTERLLTVAAASGREAESVAVGVVCDRVSRDIRSLEHVAPSLCIPRLLCFRRARGSTAAVSGAGRCGVDSA